MTRDVISRLFYAIVESQKWVPISRLHVCICARMYVLPSHVKCVVNYIQLAVHGGSAFVGRLQKMGVWSSEDGQS